MDLKARIEQVLSEILSDKHECKITIRFGGNNEKRQETDPRATKVVA